MLGYSDRYLRSYYSRCDILRRFSQPKKMWNLDLIFEVKDLVYCGMDYEALKEVNYLNHFLDYLFDNFWYHIKGFSALAPLSISKKSNIDRVRNKKKMDKYFTKWIGILHKVYES